MKKITKANKVGFFKKIFIKICRLLGYEIIDQSIFYVPTQKKSLNENLNVQGKKSITLPLGETKVSRPVKAFTVIFRSCTSVNMLTQSKKRLFDTEKSEYTLRSLNSVIISLHHAKKLAPGIEFNIFVIDHNSSTNDQTKMKKLLDKSNLKYSFLPLNVNEFHNKIKNINAKNKTVTENQKSNMSNIYKSLMVAKSDCKDLIYFVEDDYLHQENSIEEMIYGYERISSQINKELIMCPADYPYLYTKVEPTQIFLGSQVHWRVVDETLCTFLTSKNIIEKYWEKFTSMCIFEHYPFEKPLHDIYKSEYCLSPIPSLALHCTNVNSIFGLSPNINWKKIWEKNEITEN